MVAGSATCTLCSDAYPGRGRILVQPEDGYPETVAPCPCRKREAVRRRMAYLPDTMSWETWDPKRTQLEVVEGANGAGRAVPIVRLAKWVPDASGKAPFLYGKPRIGKTHAMVAMARQLLAVHTTPALYVNLQDLLARERQAMDQRPQGDLLEKRAPRPIEHAASVAVLLLDDVGAGRLSAWAMEQLYWLVDQRVLHRRPTVWASNYTPQRLERELREAGARAQAAEADAERLYARIVENVSELYHFSRMQ